MQSYISEVLLSQIIFMRNLANNLCSKVKQTLELRVIQYIIEK